MPRGKHSVLQGKLVSGVNLVLKPRRIARAFPELQCTFGGRSIVPDVAIFEWKNIPTDESGEVMDVFSLAPDWSIEILSPEQSQTRVTKNILHCLQYGTRMGWTINPLEKTVFVYRPKQEIEVFDALDVSIPVPDFAEDFQLTVGELFAWLMK
jgi:Uma2 family endonuclease